MEIWESSGDRLTSHSGLPLPSEITRSSLSRSFKFSIRHLAIASSLTIKLFKAARVCSSRVSYSSFGLIVAMTLSTAFNFTSSTPAGGKSWVKELIKNIDLMIILLLSFVCIKPRRHSSPPMSMNEARAGSNPLTIQEIACRTFTATSESSDNISMSFGRTSRSRRLCWQNGLFWASSPMSWAVSLRTWAYFELRQGKIMLEPPILKKSWRNLFEKLKKL